ncbi:MAG: HAMP domain-containing sensor histidine kinase [bacterium]|nr:HAMP domain-containing sensor histidine kinase [bacterium]
MHSLYTKFILGYLLFGLLGFITIATLSSHFTSRYLIEDKAGILYDEATLIANTYSTQYQGKNQDLASAYPQLQAVATFLQTEIWVVDQDGTIIVDSAFDKVGTVITDFDPTATGNNVYTTGRYFGLFPYDVLSVSAPITGNFQTHGYVIMHLPISVVQANSNDILNIVYLTCAIVFGLSLVILLVFTKTVFFPLKAITKAVNEYASGNLNYRLKLDTNDEMSYLAATLDYMATELNQMENYQRNFIANVSHDFRSPLTSIKGYLEAIIDGTIPPELQNKYLNIVIGETKRLTKLTEGLLTLNSMDGKGFLTRSIFDINHVIKETAASFEGTCSTKNIVFELTFVEPIEMVYADLGKIQQVLYNLIDNAIKFSHPDSVIYIQTSPRHEKIFVSVKDTGIGIPKNSIKKIWERFYKTDLSRGKDKKGTGLGLSIVKEIIQSHGENIDVISTQGVGSEFIFSLPKANN